MTTEDFLHIALTISEQLEDPDEREDAIHWLGDKFKEYQSISSPDEPE